MSEMQALALTASTMSPPGIKKRRQRAPPPARLLWPAYPQSPQSTGSSCSSAPATAPTMSFARETIVGATDNSGKVKFRPRRVTFERENVPALWTEKYAPTNSSELAVAPKKVKEISQWIETADSKVLILVGKPGIGKSTTVHVLARELGLSIHEWSEPTAAYDDTPAAHGPSLLDQEGPLMSFERFLQQAASGLSSVVLSNDSLPPSPVGKRYKVNSQDASMPPKSIVVLDYLPNLHGPTAELRFRTAMQNFLQRAKNVSVILIYSNVVEGKHRPEDLERLFDKSILYSPWVTIMQIHPPTSSRTRKALEGIAKRERLRVPQEWYDELSIKSSGDLRCAIMTMQYEQSGLRQEGRVSKTRNDCDSLTISHRDEKLSTFHALGKLLYAKREAETEDSQSRQNGMRPPLHFDPDKVIDQCDMELNGAVHFLQYHSLSFFTDLSDVVHALHCYSDAAYLLDKTTMDTYYAGDKAKFPQAHAGALAARAVAVYNHHPAPGKFRQFHAPRIFDVMRKRDANVLQTRHLLNRWSLSLDSDGNSTVSSLVARCSAAGSADAMTDCLPFLRRIVPAAAESMSSWDETPLLTDEQREQELLLKEQEQILQEDDIADFDSDTETSDERSNSSAHPMLLLTSAKTQTGPSGTAASRTDQENRPN